MGGAAGASLAVASSVAVVVAFACVELRSEYLYSAASALLAASAALGFGEARTDASGTASRRALTAARVSGSKASREGEAALDSSSAAGGANDFGGDAAADAFARLVVVVVVVAGPRPSLETLSA